MMNNRDLALAYLARFGLQVSEADVIELEAMLDTATEDGREACEWERLEPTVVSSAQTEGRA